MSLHTSTIDPNFLPNLPGFRARPHQSGGKKQFFMLVGGQVFLKDEYIPPATDDDAHSVGTFGSATINKTRKLTAPSVQPITLNFTAYFEECPEGERVPQVRVCHIYFFTEDGSLKVVEKAEQNSGTNQGTLVKRNIIMKENCTPIVEEDFQTGSVITIYGRTYK